MRIPLVEYTWISKSEIFDQPEMQVKGKYNWD